MENKTNINPLRAGFLFYILNIANIFLATDKTFMYINFPANNKRLNNQFPPGFSPGERAARKGHRNIF